MSDVNVYGAEWCHDTANTLRHLEKVGIDFDFHDVDDDPEAAEFVREQNDGKQKLPTLDVAGTILSIPSDRELDEALRTRGLLE